MPISSFPISVKSSINLSDINIDTDLNMGTNKIIGYAKNVYPIIHGVTPLNYGNLVGSEVLILNDDTVYSTEYQYTGTWYTKITLTLTEALSELIISGRQFRLTWENELKNSSTYTTYTQMGIPPKFTGYDGSGSTYQVKGGIRSILTYNPYSYNDALIIQVKTASGAGYIRNNKVWLIGWIDHYPNVITDDLWESYGFNGVAGIELFNGDSVKLNNDLIYNGTTYPTTPSSDSSLKYYYNKLTDLDSLEQIEVLSGHPKITFKI